MSETSPVIQYFLSAQFLLALVISVALIPLLRRPALKFGLVDNPHGRKRHKVPVPLAGGPAIVIATAISLYIWGLPAEYEGMVCAAMGLFLIGMLDDKHDISAKLRLVFQASLVTAALWWDNTWISDISITDNFILQLGFFKYIISVIAVLGVMNAINMLDGLDGLSAGVVLIILGFLIGISVAAGETGTSLVGICIFGSVLGFWAYNYRFEWREKASVFLGDSGTTVLGFILPVLAIKLSVVAPTYAPKSVLVWLFAIPIWDICAVIIKRLRDGESPLEARRDHIHHVLMNAGLTVRHSLHLIYLLTVATISFGVSIQFFSLTKIEAYVAFIVFMLAYLTRVGSLSKTSRAEIYDLESLGDRREPIFNDEVIANSDFEENKVIQMNSRSKTLS